MTELTWEEGIIGKLETFLLKRFPIGPMWARSIGTSIVSAALSKPTLEDGWGDVKPSLYFLYVALSGLGCKTPPIKMVRKIITEFDRSLLCPTKFTPEGFTEWVIGVKKKKTKKEEDEREPIKKHYANFIVKDEGSKIIGEIQSQYLVKKEYLSECWDNWIEGYYTRKYQYEGGVPVYVTMLLASSDIFFDVLDEGFFKQGLGNRILWIIEEPSEPEKLNPKKFFFAFTKTDEEFNEIKKRTIDMLTQISESAVGVFVDSNAAEKWVDYQHECAQKAYKVKAKIGSFEVKQPLNALKLAICYAASRLNIHNNLVMIVGQDMERAITDTKIYNKMWFKAMEWWETIKGRKEAREERIPTSKYDLGLMMEVAIVQKDNLFTVSTIRGTLDLPDANRITKVLLIGIDKGWLEIAAETSEQGDLTSEQYERFKPNRGFYPRIYRVTEKGKESISKRYDKGETKNDSS